MLVEFELKFAAILLTSYGCLMLLLLEKVAPDALLIKVPLVQLYISLDKDLQVTAIHRFNLTVKLLVEFVLTIKYLWHFQMPSCLNAV